MANSRQSHRFAEGLRRWYVASASGVGSSSGARCLEALSARAGIDSCFGVAMASVRAGALLALGMLIFGSATAGARRFRFRLAEGGAERDAAK